MPKKSPVPAADMDLQEMAAHANAASKLLKSLANQHRLLLLCRLAEGEASVGELNAKVPLSQSALSQHLSVLRRDGLVTTRREGQSIYYSLQEGPGLEVIHTLHGIYCCSREDR